MAAKQIRRVVTGHDAAGKAVVISDEAASVVFESPKLPGVALTDLWQSDRNPAAVDGATETVGGPFKLLPPAHGTVFRIVEFQPEDPDLMKNLDGVAALGEMAAADTVFDNARHPYMHRTDTVDYAIVLSGEITMLLDEGEVDFKAGDTLVQRGTNHAWTNRGSEPCLVAFVLVDGAR